MYIDVYLYSAILCSGQPGCALFKADSLRSSHMQPWISGWVTVALHCMFWISTEAVYLHCYTHNTAAISVHILCTPCNPAPVYFLIWSNIIIMVNACSAVDPATSTSGTVTWTFYIFYIYIYATVVTWGWNGYQNKSTESWPQRRKVTRQSESLA